MGVTVKCCRCGEGFDERKLEGSWLDRRCPRCGKRVSEWLYDKAARHLIKDAAGELSRGDRRQLKRLAQARYYTSEWFRLACAGQGSEAPDKGLFGLSASYDAASGEFHLTPTDGDRSPEGGWGVSAEYYVYDAIRAEIARKGSPLAGALLVPHLVFPWLPGQKPKQWGARCRAESDCVLMTRSCAVVVEVKRHSHHVRVGREFRNVRERTERGSFKSSPDAVRQVARSADAFCERQQLYPPERVFKLVVYVKPLSFECACKRSPFADGLFTSSLDDSGARFLPALVELVEGLDPIAGKRAVHALGMRLLDEFGNTNARRAASIVSAGAGKPARKRNRTDAMLDAIEKRCGDARSPLYGGRLVRGLTCEVEVNQRKGRDSGKGPGTATKKMDVTALLLTRTHAVLVNARRWSVHVNTHAPFATVYTGDPADGAKHVDDAIRHDWDLDAIHYRNRSHSLTLLTYAAKIIGELDGYRQRNRVCTLNAFVDPKSFFSTCAEFRSRTFIGYWKGRDENIIGALERLVAGATPVMEQVAVDALVDTIGGGGA